MGNTCCFAERTHAALDVLQFGQDVQGEAVGLPPRAVTAVHEVAESQDQPEHLQHGLAGLQSLGAHSAKRRHPVRVGESRFRISSACQWDDILKNIIFKMSSFEDDDILNISLFHLFVQYLFGMCSFIVLIP